VFSSLLAFLFHTPYVAQGLCFGKQADHIFFALVRRREYDAEYAMIACDDRLRLCASSVPELHVNGRGIDGVPATPMMDAFGGHSGSTFTRTQDGAFLSTQRHRMT
jgi:hypothetical protein